MSLSGLRYVTTAGGQQPVVSNFEEYWFIGRSNNDGIRASKQVPLPDPGHVLVIFNSTLEIWRIVPSPEQCVAVLKGHRDRIVSCTGTRRLVASQDLGGVIRVWNRATGMCQLAWCAPSGGQCLKFSESGSMLIGETKGTVVLWNATNGDVMQRFAVFDNDDEDVKGIQGVVDCAISRDETTALVVSFGAEYVDSVISVWDIGTGILLQTIGFDHEVRSLCLSPYDDSFFIRYMYLARSFNRLQRLPGPVIHAVSVPNAPSPKSTDLNHTQIITRVAFSSCLSLDCSLVAIATE
jgi:WD40 repeat protein